MMSTLQAVEMGFTGDEFMRLRFLGESAWLALSLGDLERAEAIFDALEVLSPEDPVAPLGHAEILLARGDARGAKAAARRLQSAAGADTSTQSAGLILEARAALLEGDPEAARTPLTAVHALAPDGEHAKVAAALLEEIERLHTAATVVVRRGEER